MQSEPLVFTSTVPVAGNGDYLSGTFTPTVAGTYQWVADYSGDANNLPSFSTCSNPDEVVLVVAGLVTPVLTTTASPSVAVGGQVTDTAHLSGGTNPTGTVTFALFGPDDASCTGSLAFSSTVTVAGPRQLPVRTLHDHPTGPLPVDRQVQR